MGADVGYAIQKQGRFVSIFSKIENDIIKEEVLDGDVMSAQVFTEDEIKKLKDKRGKLISKKELVEVLIYTANFKKKG